MTFTIKKIAKELGINESTCRFWRDRHENFIPCVGQGRKRRYPMEALEILRLISKLAAEGKNADEINEVLASKHGVIDIPQNAAAATEQQLPPVKDNMTMFAEVMAEALSPGFEKLMGELGSIKQELKRSRTQESIITQQQQQIEKLESEAAESQILKAQVADLTSKLNRLFEITGKQPVELEKPSQSSVSIKTQSEQQKRRVDDKTLPMFPDTEPEPEQYVRPSHCTDLNADKIILELAAEQKKKNPNKRISWTEITKYLNDNNLLTSTGVRWKSNNVRMRYNALTKSA